MYGTLLWHKNIFFTWNKLTFMFAKLYVRIGILLTCRKHLHGSIISLRGEVWALHGGIISLRGGVWALHDSIISLRGEVWAHKTSWFQQCDIFCFVNLFDNNFHHNFCVYTE